MRVARACTCVRGRCVADACACGTDSDCHRGHSADCSGTTVAGGTIAAAPAELKTESSCAISWSAKCSCQSASQSAQLTPASAGGPAPLGSAVGVWVGTAARVHNGCRTKGTLDCGLARQSCQPTGRAALRHSAAGRDGYCRQCRVVCARCMLYDATLQPTRNGPSTATAATAAAAATAGLPGADHRRS